MDNRLHKNYKICYGEYVDILAFLVFFFIISGGVAYDVKTAFPTIFSRSFFLPNKNKMKITGSIRPSQFCTTLNKLTIVSPKGVTMKQSGSRLYS